MIDRHPPYSSSEPFADRPEPIRWAAFGIDKHWVASQLRSVLSGKGGAFAEIPAPATLDELSKADADLLFLGHELCARGTTDLEEQLGVLGRHHPLACCIAVAPSASLGKQLSLLRSGALEVVQLDADDGRIAQAIEHAAAVVRGRRRAADAAQIKLISQLVISVNHEINNPLTGLMGTAELMLMENKELSEKAVADLRLILQQSRRIQEVTLRLKNLNHLRTVPYGAHDRMIDLAGEIPLAPPRTEADAGDSFLARPSLLVADDNPLIIDLIMRLFEQTYVVDGAVSPAEALKKIEARDYDLVMIDLIMPEMNGLELFQAVKARKPRQKMVMTTGASDDPRIAEALRSGALGCVNKPFHIVDLEKALAQALRGETIPL